MCAENISARPHGQFQKYVQGASPLPFPGTSFQVFAVRDNTPAYGFLWVGGGGGGAGIPSRGGASELLAVM